MSLSGLADRRLDLVVHRDDPDDFPDFILLNRATDQQTWIEIVEAVESGGLIAAERRAERLCNAAAREYRVRGEEVVLTVSRHGVEDVTPSPGFGVTGLISPGSPRKITPPEWIARALDRKGRATRYGPTERARTILVIDCSPEVFIGSEDAVMNAVMEKRLPNNAEERAAGSRSLAAAAHRSVASSTGAVLAYMYWMVVMGKVKKIEQQVQALSPEELAQFRAWFLEYDWAAWDRQMEQDVRAGRLDALAEQALHDHATGKTKPL